MFLIVFSDYNSDFRFYRSTKKKGTYVKIGTSTSAKFTDTNATGGKTYYYKLASYTVTEKGTFVYTKLSAAKKIKVKKQVKGKKK